MAVKKEKSVNESVSNAIVAAATAYSDGYAVNVLAVITVILLPDNVRRFKCKYLF